MVRNVRDDIGKRGHVRRFLEIVSFHIVHHSGKEDTGGFDATDYASNEACSLLRARHGAGA